MTDKIQELSEKIKQQLAAGIHLTPAVVHYIESVAGAACAEDLGLILADPETDDAQTLFELLFFPDESQQCFFEPFLEQTIFDAQETEAVAEALVEKEIHSRLIFPDGSRTDAIEIPADALRQFVRRLSLRRCIPEAVAESIQKHVTDRNQAIQAKVKLRNGRFAFSENIVSFLCAYLANMPTDAADFLERMAFALAILDEINDDSDIYIYLMGRKRQCAEMIRIADDSAKQLREMPVEALIMKGISIPCVSTDEARRQIDIIDEIALRVFGRTEMMADLMAEPGNNINLGVFKGHEDIDKVIKILS